MTSDSESRRGRFTPLKRLTDDELAAEAARGNDKAFAVLFERLHEPLYRYSLSILGNPEEARDALQNAMLKAYRALRGETREIAARPWLYRIARNESVSALRGRRPLGNLDEAVGVAAAGADADAASRERLSELVADLRSLPERQRSALVLRELSGLDYEELGAALDISPNAARQTVFKARVSMQANVEGRTAHCDEVRAAMSKNDGRFRRRRSIQAHLERCPVCTEFAEGLERRPRDMAALFPPLPAGVAAGIVAATAGDEAAAEVGGEAAAATGGEAAEAGDAGAGAAAATEAPAPAAATPAPRDDERGRRRALVPLLLLLLLLGGAVAMAVVAGNAGDDDDSGEVAQEQAAGEGEAGSGSSEAGTGSGRDGSGADRGGSDDGSAEGSGSGGSEGDSGSGRERPAERDDSGSGGSGSDSDSGSASGSGGDSGSGSGSGSRSSGGSGSGDSASGSGGSGSAGSDQPLTRVVCEEREVARSSPAQEGYSGRAGRIEVELQQDCKRVRTDCLAEAGSGEGSGSGNGSGSDGNGSGEGSGSGSGGGSGSGSGSDSSSGSGDGSDDGSGSGSGNGNGSGEGSGSGSGGGDGSGSGSGSGSDADDTSAASRCQAVDRNGLPITGLQLGLIGGIALMLLALGISLRRLARV